MLSKCSTPSKFTEKVESAIFDVFSQKSKSNDKKVRVEHANYVEEDIISCVKARGFSEMVLVVNNGINGVSEGKGLSW